jgi:hypothetical protein
VNLKNYPLICDSFERELRVGESDNFIRLENFGLREFLQNSGLKTYRQNNYDPLTHTYALWAADVLLAVLAPAFPLSPLRQEIRPQPAQAHSLSR